MRLAHFWLVLVRTTWACRRLLWLPPVPTLYAGPRNLRSSSPPLHLLPPCCPRPRLTLPQPIPSPPVAPTSPLQQYSVQYTSTSTSTLPPHAHPGPRPACNCSTRPSPGLACLFPLGWSSPVQVFPTRYTYFPTEQEFYSSPRLPYLYSTPSNRHLSIPLFLSPSHPSTLSCSFEFAVAIPFNPIRSFTVSAAAVCCVRSSRVSTRRDLKE